MIYTLSCLQYNENQTWKKQSLEIYHNEKQGCFWSNEYWYDNVNFLQKKNGRSLLLEQDTLRWDDDICFVLD